MAPILKLRAPHFRVALQHFSPPLSRRRWLERLGTLGVPAGLIGCAGTGLERVATSSDPTRTWINRLTWGLAQPCLRRGASRPSRLSSACGGMLRPDVVYFGEHVPREVFAHAAAIVAAASSLIIAGSSLAVNTGVRLVHRAEARGLPVAVINRGPTQIDRRDSVTVRIEAGTSETFARLARLLSVVG